MLDFLSQSIPDFNHNSISTKKENYTLGVLPEEGVGPEVIDASLQVLEMVTENSDKSFNVQRGGSIGKVSFKETGKYLSDEVIDFCHKIFSEGGAVLCGPGGGRFVYELRSHFDLYCKFTPLKPSKALQDSGILRPKKLKTLM